MVCHNHPDVPPPLYSPVRVKRFWRYYGRQLLWCAVLLAVTQVTGITEGWWSPVSTFLVMAMALLLCAFMVLDDLPLNYRFAHGALIVTDVSGAEERYERWVRTRELGMRVIHAQSGTKTLRLPEAAYVAEDAGRVPVV